MDDLFDFVMEKLVTPAVALIVAAALLFLLVGLPMLAYKDWKASKSPTFTLRKSEWACTNVQTIPVTTYVQTGKVMLPVTTNTKVCHQWSRQP